MAARQAVLAQNFELAADFASALLQANPNDRTALVVMAAVQPQLGLPREGRRAGARAFRLSTTQSERYEAARLTALAAANEEKYTLSQWWLRRAAINAPDERAYRQTQSDFRGVRNLNPWSINIGFSVAPSSNVNGGTDAEFNIIDGVTYPDGSPVIGFFDGAARALPGTSATADVRLKYGISRSAEQSTSISARAYARTVWLSSEGRAIAPDSRNSDFGSQLVEFSLDHSRRLGDGVLSAQGIVGASWFGGDLRSGFLRGRLGYRIQLSDRTSLTLTSQIEQTYDPDPWTRNNHGATLTTSLAHVLESGNRVTGSLSFAGQSSDNLNERYEAVTAQVGYNWVDPIGPMLLSVSAGVSLSDYRNYTILVPVPNGRQDTRIFGSVTAIFPDIEYAGFVPTMTLSMQDTTSNVSRFPRDEYSVNIGVRSSF